MIDFITTLGKPCIRTGASQSAPYRAGRSKNLAQVLGYGQRVGGIAQTAFVVADLDAAIAHWVRDLGAGPFFVLEHLLAPGQTYRGRPSTADVRLAMGFAGHMLIELLQPLDDEPSVYRETIALRGYGFHHLGIAYADVEVTCADYRARGYAEAYRAAVPTGGEVVYLDDGTGPSQGFIELLPATPLMDATFTRFWRASFDWDGADPVRPFIEKA